MLTKDKNVGLQILRGLAAWTVVFHHYNQLFFGFKYESLLGYLFYSRGQFGIDIFFVLSGFLMYIVAAKTKNTTDFLLKRVSRVFPAYIFFTTLLLICLFIFPYINNLTTFNLKFLICSYLMIPMQNPSGIGYYPLLTVGWTLSLELCFYVIVYFSLVCSKKYFFFLVIIISYIFPLFIKIEMFEYMHTFIYGFIFAYFYNKFEQLSVILSKKEIRAFIVFMIILLFGGAFGWDIQIKAFCATLVLILFLEVKDELASKFKILGDISYSTYLFHSIPMLILMHSINLPNSGLLENILFVILFSTFIFIVSLLSYKYIEKPFLWTNIKYKQGSR
ncbi:acyltransferase family protein [Francisella philomiragia]|uniref:acyltransferase family protein n=1 Tax=Francisella philomiragia TaxID=28110 RepID=UPI001C9D972A|nr:acyltransferase [Francisella philomiragia]MBY7734763.1 acyltransferase [Francisella philomiragia]